jgi:hypothetical protein
MTATNHAVTGAIIGAMVANPVAALVLAFLSHFVLDAIPHFGVGKDSDAFIKSRRFSMLLIADATLCFCLVLGLAIAHPGKWWFIAICAFIATSPDFASFNRWRQARKGKIKDWKAGWFIRFAAWIQWFEHPIGAIVEAVWFVSAITILVTVLRIRG